MSRAPIARRTRRPRPVQTFGARQNADSSYTCQHAHCFQRMRIQITCTIDRSIARSSMELNEGFECVRVEDLAAATKLQHWQSDRMRHQLVRLVSSSRCSGGAGVEGDADTHTHSTSPPLSLVGRFGPVPSRPLAGAWSGTGCFLVRGRSPFAGTIAERATRRCRLTDEATRVGSSLRLCVPLGLPARWRPTSTPLSGEDASDAERSTFSDRAMTARAVGSRRKGGPRNIGIVEEGRHVLLSADR